MVPEEGSVDDFDPRDQRRKFTNLTPGTLYTFTVRTVRDRSFGDPVTIRQDTSKYRPIPYGKFFIVRMGCVGGSMDKRRCSRQKCLPH